MSKSSLERDLESYGSDNSSLMMEPEQCKNEKAKFGFCEKLRIHFYLILFSFIVFGIMIIQLSSLFTLYQNERTYKLITKLDAKVNNLEKLFALQVIPTGHHSEGVLMKRNENFNTDILEPNEKLDEIVNNLGKEKLRQLQPTKIIPIKGKHVEPTPFASSDQLNNLNASKNTSELEINADSLMEKVKKLENEESRAERCSELAWAQQNFPYAHNENKVNCTILYELDCCMECPECCQECGTSNEFYKTIHFMIRCLLILLIPVSVYSILLALTYFFGHFPCVHKYYF